MLKLIKAFNKSLRVRSAILFVLLVSIINLTACGGSDGDDEFKEAVK